MPESEAHTWCVVSEYRHKREERDFERKLEEVLRDFRNLFSSRHCLKAALELVKMLPETPFDVQSDESWADEVYDLRKGLNELYVQIENKQTALLLEVDVDV